MGVHSPSRHSTLLRHITHRHTYMTLLQALLPCVHSTLLLFAFLIPISDYILLAHQLSAALRAATWRTSNFVWGLQGWCNGLMSIGVIFSCPGMGSLCNVDCDFCCLQTINKVFVQYCKHYANLCNFDQTRVLTTYLFTNIVARLDMAACA
jgi:hypothetical protein